MTTFRPSEMSLEEFTVRSASKDPVPGGGGVSALAGSLAASLAEMVTNLTIGKKKYIEYTEELITLREKAESLRKELLACIERDAEAFAPLAEAYSLPKDTEGYALKMENCLRDAAKPPFAIMELCKEVIELDERLSVIGSKLAVSDAATSVILAHGAMYGSYMNVIVNTRLMKDKDYAAGVESKAGELLDHYGPKALEIYDSVLRRLTNG
jgi:formiminotetrahydrofolate cyclodeaminase